MTLTAIVTRYTKEDTPCEEDIGRFSSIVFDILSDGVSIEITIVDGDHRLDNPSKWMELLHESNCTLTFGSQYGSHVDNGSITIERDDTTVTFFNDNALGCSTSISYSFNQCEQAFKNIRDECFVR